MPNNVLMEPPPPARPRQVRDRHHPGKGRRGGRIVKAKPISPETRARLAGAPEHVHRALDHIVELRLLRGEGPTIVELWEVAHGRPLPVHQRYKAEHFQRYLFQFGVRFKKPGQATRGRNGKIRPERSTFLVRNVYELLKPRVIAQLTERVDPDTGYPVWPPHDDHGRPFRYRGPRGPIR